MYVIFIFNKPYLYHLFNLNFTVYRIHWLRARAEKNRWSEELYLTEHEMVWTVKYYMYMAKLWEKRRMEYIHNQGLKAYAEQQIALWNDLGRVTQNLFRRVNFSHSQIWSPIPHLIVVDVTLD